MEISENDLLNKMVIPLKQRLQEAANLNISPEWEKRTCQEHSDFIDYLKQGQ